MPTPRANRIAVLLAGVALALALVHGLLRLTYQGRALPISLTSWLDMTQDLSLPSLFSIGVQLAAGWALLRAGKALRSSWCSITGAMFVYLGIDDACCLHEQLGALVFPFFHGLDTYAWVIVLGPVFAALGFVCFLGTARQLQQDPLALRLLFLGFACMGLAVALESGEQHLTASGLQLRGHPLVRYAQLVEEELEMLGPILALWAALSVVERHRAVTVTEPTRR